MGQVKVEEREPHMNILVLGSGGREHALTWALAKSDKTEKLFVAPGNGGRDSGGMKLVR